MKIVVTEIRSFNECCTKIKDFNFDPGIFVTQIHGLVLTQMLQIFETLRISLLCGDFILILF